MTRSEFLDAVRSLGRTWRVDPDGALRTDDTRRDCPITAVYYHAFSGATPPGHTHGWWWAAKRLGLSRDTALAIARAADWSAHASPIIRRGLEEAVGLREWDGR